MPLLSSSISIARELAGTDSNALTDTLAVDFSNYASAKMLKMLIDKGIDAAPIKETTINITDGTGIYNFPTDMFYVPKYMSINVTDPTDNNKWVQFGKLSESNTPANQGIEWLRKNQASSSPLVNYNGSSFETLPTPTASTWGGASGSTLSNAIRIIYYQQPTLYAVNIISTVTMNNPENVDYFTFAELIKTVYFYSIGKITETDMETVFEKVVGKMISMIQGDGMAPTKANPLLITGWEF